MSLVAVAEADSNGQAESVETLLEARADPAARDNDGKQSFDYAIDNEQLEGTDAYLLGSSRFRFPNRACGVHGDEAMKQRIALLGWGSLLWDRDKHFDDHHNGWECDGPTLRLEFSRISESREGALTLVIDPHHGSPVTVAWSMSSRTTIEEVVCDLKKREKTKKKNGIS